MTTDRITSIASLTLSVAAISVAAWLSTPAVAPEPGPKTTEPALVIVTDAAGKRITDEAIEAVAAKLAVGQWRVQAIPKPGEVGWSRLITVAAVDQPIPAPPAPVPPVPTPVPPTPPTPPTPPVPPQPSHPLAAFRTHPLAAEVAAATLAFADVLKSHPVATLGEFKAKLAEFYALAFASNAGGMPGFSMALEASFVETFGRDDGPLDPVKAQAFLAAAAAALGVS